MSPNPDGSTGIFIHADIGQSCAGASTAVCEGADCATLCGDWGGFDELALDDEVISSWSSAWDGAQYWHATTSRDRGWRTAVAPARHGLFHYVWLYLGNGRVSGQSKGTGSNSLRLPYGNDFSVTAHELGHCLGLSHSGAQPGTLINNSTAYPSTMNYTYQSRLSGVVDRPRFSRGEMERIDHTSLDETSYSPDVSAADRAYLGASPLHYDLTLGNTGDAVDFNYDGRLNSPSGLPVQYDTAPMTAYGGLGWPDLYQNRQVGAEIPTGGGALAIEPVTVDERIATVWAFAPFEHTDGVYPDYTSFRNDVLAEAQSSNLAHFDNWVPGVPMNGHPDGEVAAVSFEFSFGRRTLLLFPDVNGVLHYRLVDSMDPGAGSWMPIPGWVPSSRARQASVTVVKGAPGNGDDRIDIVFKDINVGDFIPHVYLTSIDVNGNWSSEPQLQVLPDGTGVGSYFTPGIAEAPDGYVYMAALYTGSIEPARIRRLYFLRRASSDTSGSWEEIAALGTTVTGLEGQGTSMPLRRRLNLIFLPYLEQGHRPFPDGSGYLAVFYNSGYAGSATWRDYWFHNRIYTTGFISPSQTQYGSPLGRRMTVAIDRPFPSHSTAVARRWNDAVSLHTAVAFWTGDAKPAVYQPFASGTPPVSYETAADFVDPFDRTVSIGINADTDDAAIMSRSMCRSVRFLYGQCNCDPEKVDSSCEFDPVETPPDFPELVE